MNAHSHNGRAQYFAGREPDELQQTCAVQHTGYLRLNTERQGDMKKYGTPLTVKRMAADRSNKPGCWNKSWGCEPRLEAQAASGRVAAR
jgi:hypothetical protein